MKRRFIAVCAVLLVFSTLAAGCQPKKVDGVITEAWAGKLALSYLPIVYDRINTAGHFHFELVNPRVVDVNISEKESICIVEIRGMVMEHPAFPKGYETVLWIYLDPHTGEYQDFHEAL